MRTEFDYDPGTGKLTSIADVSGRTTTLSYDGTTGLLESVTDFGGGTTDYTYDNGWLDSVAQPQPNGGATRPTVSFEYFTTGDATGLLKKIIDERIFETSFLYDAARGLDSTTAPLPQDAGNFTTELTSVQSAGALALSPLAVDQRLGTYTDPFDRDFTFTTDRFGGITFWKDLEDNETTRVFDELGRLEILVEPDPDAGMSATIR